MIRTILVTATGDPTDAVTFATALAVARNFGAHLEMLHVRADAINAGVAMATGAGSGAITAGLIEQLEADASQREARAREGFERFCAGAGVAVSAGAPAAQSNFCRSRFAEFHAETGREADWVSWNIATPPTSSSPPAWDGAALTRVRRSGSGTA